MQDENRFASKGAHLNLKCAECAINKLPGMSWHAKFIRDQNAEESIELRFPECKNRFKMLVSIDFMQTKTFSV